MSIKEAEKRKKCKYILMEFVILTFLFTISGSLPVTVDLSYHLVSFLYSNIAVFLSTSFMLLLANILHFYVL